MQKATGQGFPAVGWHWIAGKRSLNDTETRTS